MLLYIVKMFPRWAVGQTANKQFTLFCGRIYVCVCVCVCVLGWVRRGTQHRLSSEMLETPPPLPEDVLEGTL